MLRTLTILDDSPIRMAIKTSLATEYLDFVLERSLPVCPPSVYQKETSGSVPFKYHVFLDALRDNWYGFVGSLPEQQENVEKEIKEATSVIKHLFNLVGQHPSHEDLEVCSAGVVLSRFVQVTIVSDDGDLLFWFQMLASVMGWNVELLSTAEWFGRLDRRYFNPAIEACFRHYGVSVEPGALRKDAVSSGSEALRRGLLAFTGKAFATAHPRFETWRELLDGG